MLRKIISVIRGIVDHRLTNHAHVGSALNEPGLCSCFGERGKKYPHEYCDNPDYHEKFYKCKRFPPIHGTLLVHLPLPRIAGALGMDACTVRRSTEDYADVTRI